MQKYDTAKLETARLAQGLSIAKLAKKARLKYSAAWDTIRGRSESPPTVAALAKVLGIDMAHLLVKRRK